MKNIFTITFLVCSTFLHGQIFENHREEINLKGDVKFVYYDNIYFHHIPIFKVKQNFIGHNYYLRFNKKGNIEYYGQFKKDSLTGEKIIITKKTFRTNKNTINKNNPNGQIVETEICYNLGYYKGHIKNKKIYEYHYYGSKAYRTTEFKGNLDTLDIGYQYINSEPEKFSEKQHTEYTFYKNIVSIYNDKKQLVRIHYYDNSIQFKSNGTYNGRYDLIIELEYDENNNIIFRKEKNSNSDDFKIPESYKYKFDQNNNWIQKTIICNNCRNGKDKISDVINREIIYWKN